MKQTKSPFLARSTELTATGLVALELTTVSGTVVRTTRGWFLAQQEFVMSRIVRMLALSIMITAGPQTASAAEREQVRMVINLVAGVKMPYPEHLRNNLAHTERVHLDTNGATVACLRLDDKIRWCYEHIAAAGARAEMLRIRNEPVSGLLVGQLFHYVDDLDLDGSIDIGSTTKLEGEPHAPVGKVIQFFYRAAGRGDQFRADYQKLYDEGIQVALKYLGE